MIKAIEIFLGRELWYSEVICVWFVLGCFVVATILGAIGWILTARDYKRRKNERKQSK